MFMTLTKNQVKEQLKELISFCKENHCLMWNFMIMVQGIRNERRELEKISKENLELIELCKIPWKKRTSEQEKRIHELIGLEKEVESGN